MTVMTETTNMTETKESLFHKASSKLLALEKMIDEKRKYLAMLNNNTQYKQKMEQENDNNYKAWLIYSYPKMLV